MKDGKTLDLFSAHVLLTALGADDESQRSQRLGAFHL